MSNRTADHLARTIRGAIRGVARSTPDAELLAVFVQSRDPAAFDGIMRRHGPMVLAACRAILPNPADADDACQATFVVFYRKAQTIRDAGTLGGWLFRVARRAALELKESTARRRTRESLAARPESAPGPDASWREACAILHGELDRLPAKYRLPIIACYLEGKTRDEAAAELGWPADVLRGRIERGRAKLRSRLRRRGIALSVGLLAVALPSARPTGLLAAIAAPSPRVAELTQVLASSAGRAWAGMRVLGLSIALCSGAVLLESATSSQPSKLPPPRESKVERVEPRFDAFGDPLPEGAIARIGTVRFNHGNGLAALQFSQDGKWVLSTGSGHARLWDAQTGKLLHDFQPEKSSHLDRATLTPDGRVILLSQDHDRQALHIWDAAKGIKLLTKPLRGSGDSISQRITFSPNGRICALQKWGRLVEVVNTETGETLSKFELGIGLATCCFAGNDQLVVADAKQVLHVLDPRTGKSIRQIDHGGPVEVLRASADGRLVATLEHHVGAIDRLLEKDVIHLWDVTTGTKWKTFVARPQRWFISVCLSQDGKRLAAQAATASQPELLVWDTESGELIHQVPMLFSKVLGFSPDGKQLAIGGNRFELVDLANEKRINRGEARLVQAAAIGISSDGSRVSLTGYDSVSTWDATTGRKLTSHDLPAFNSMDPVRRCSPDGRFTSTYEGDYRLGKMVVREVATGKAVLTVDPGIGEVAFSPDSKRIAVPHYEGETKTACVQVRDLKTGAVVHTIRRAKSEWVKCLSLVNDGTTLIVCGERVVGYSVEDGKVLFTWRIPRAVVKDKHVALAPNTDFQPPWRVFTVSPDGALAAGLREFEDFGRNTLAERLFICAARTGQVLHRCSDSGRKGSNWGAIRFSPDSRLLATSDQYSIHVWEAATGKRIRTLAGHQNEIADLAFSGNGRRLASASFDSTVLIWELTASAMREPADGWNDLASADAATAYAAVWRLADAPDETSLPIFRKYLRPATAAESAKIARLVADLDSDQFRVRDQATRELANLGHAARPAMQAAMSNKPSAEAAGRLEQLLAKVVGPPNAGESLRIWRALGALEAKGSVAAKDLLSELAAGASDAWLTVEAKASLRRIEAR